MLRRLLMAMVAPKGASLRRTRDGSKYVSDRTANARLHDELRRQLLPECGRHTPCAVVEEASDWRVGHGIIATRLADPTRAGGARPLRRRYWAHDGKPRLAASRNACRALPQAKNVSKMQFSFILDHFQPNTSRNLLVRTQSQ